MAVKLRLMRMGKKKQPTYRVVAADSRSPRNGRFIEVLGFYNPRTDPSTIEIDNDKAVGWLRNGAKPTERVEKLLRVSGAWSEFTGEAPPEPYVAPAQSTREAAKAHGEESAPAAEAPPAEEATPDSEDTPEPAADASEEE